MEPSRFLSCSFRVLVLAFLGLYLWVDKPLLAQDQRIFQMIHTAWGARDGAPQNINSLAQTADGLLWLGTRDGLYSFDGLTFSAFQPVSGSMPRRNVQSLFATKDGDLWASGSGTQIFRIRDRVVTAFNRVDGDSFHSIYYIQQSSDKTIWGILNGQKLVRLGSDNVWHIIFGSTPDSQQMGAFFIDSSDTQWLVADNLLYRREHQDKVFQCVEVVVYGPAKFEEARDHTIWIAGYDPMGVKPQVPAGQPPEAPLKHVDKFGKRLANPITTQDVTDITASSDGTLWVSHVGAGLQHLRFWEMDGMAARRPYPSDVFGTRDGLMTTGYRALLCDRHGNIWSAGGRGLDRFQRATMIPAIPGATNGLWSFCIATNGDVWLSLFDGFFAVIRHQRLIRLKDQISTRSLLCSEDGSVWLQGNGGIATVRNDQVKILPLLPDHGNYVDTYIFTSLVELPDRRLLASTSGATENGVWVYDNKKWRPFLSSSEVSRVHALWKDSKNSLYLGSTDGRIVVLDPVSFRVISSQSTEIGRIRGFASTSYGVAAFGENGIALRSGSAFRLLVFANSDSVHSTTGLVEDSNQNIWINGVHTIARISSAEMLAAMTNRRHLTQLHEFREGEYYGSDNPGPMRNSAQMDRQGIIWLATANGVIYIDPLNTERPSQIPTVKIQSIAADGALLSGKRTFPPGTQTVNVRYVGIDLSNPMDVIYRYKLLGSDSDWQDVGKRAEAVYTHLRPKTYTFEVMASDGTGSWSQPVESVPFKILPTFYQTWWFECLVILNGILLLWTAHNARFRYVSKAIRMRTEVQVAERIRIARELHDTLLQSVQGLMLSFHVAAKKVPDSHESKLALEKALSTADRVMLDARDRLSNLRSEQFTSNELEPSIEAFAANLLDPSTIEFAMDCRGNRKPINPDVLEELGYIAREAITNSFWHSGGSHIFLNIDYGKDRFTMEFCDDGHGFSEATIGEAESKGHWGFRGMAERAGKIGARFSYESVSSQGTRICVVLPARRAYLRNKFLWNFLGHE